MHEGCRLPTGMPLNATEDVVTSWSRLDAVDSKVEINSEVTEKVQQVCRGYIMFRVQLCLVSISICYSTGSIAKV